MAPVQYHLGRTHILGLFKILGWRWKDVCCLDLKPTFLFDVNSVLSVWCKAFLHQAEIIRVQFDTVVSPASQHERFPPFIQPLLALLFCSWSGWMTLAGFCELVLYCGEWNAVAWDSPTNRNSSAARVCSWVSVFAFRALELYHCFLNVAWNKIIVTK